MPRTCIGCSKPDHNAATCPILKNKTPAEKALIIEEAKKARQAAYIKSYREKKDKESVGTYEELKNIVVQTPPPTPPQDPPLVVPEKTDYVKKQQNLERQIRLMVLQGNLLSCLQRAQHIFFEQQELMVRVLEEQTKYNHQEPKL